ncbi:BA5345 family protein [Paenibacillus sp. CMAA1364]
MNTEFQVLRWGIPGWLFLLTIALFRFSIYEFKISEIVRLFENPSALAGIAALFVAIGVPIGYIIYQIYFFFKWNFGNSKIYLSIKEITYLEKEIKRRKKKNSNDDWKIIEDYTDYLMSVVAFRKKISSDDLKRRYDWISSRTSRIHGLGASTWSIVLGLLGSFIHSYNVLHKFNFYTLISIISILLVLCVIWKNYNIQNKNGFRQLNALLRDIERAEDINNDK